MCVWKKNGSTHVVPQSRVPLSQKKCSEGAIAVAIESSFIISYNTLETQEGDLMEGHADIDTKSCPQQGRIFMGKWILREEY